MNAVPRRRTLLMLGLILPVYAAAAQTDPDALPLVTDTLAAAKSKAEEAVQVVNLHGTGNPTVQVGAMQKYGSARAAFNGFIESLITERDPEAVVSNVAYRNELDRAREAQEAFIDYVQEKVIDPLPKGGKAPIGDLLEGVAHLFDGLSNLGKSAVAVHKEYTRESDARRNDIRKQLEGLKWLQFSRIQ